MTVVAWFASVIISLYSSEIREIVESDVLAAMARWAPIAIGILLSNVLTWRVTNAMWSRRKERQMVREAAMEIRTEDLEEDVPPGELVVGRELHYLEHWTDSHDLVFLLHGLGLDAEDFRPFLGTTELHAVAPTMFGFDRRDSAKSYPPISLTTHVQIISSFIQRYHARHPEKRITVVGFSMGADLIMALAEHWQRYPQASPSVHGTLLIDPNINHSTMDFSSAIAKADVANPLPELQRLVQQTQTIEQFKNLCEYLTKIIAKNLTQIQRHAQDMMRYWDSADAHELFLQRLSTVHGMTSRVRVLFSLNYEAPFNLLLSAARAKGVDRKVFVATNTEHFEQIRPHLLGDRVAELHTTGR